MKLLRKLIYFAIIVCLIFPSTIHLANAEGPDNFANCRLGVGGVEGSVSGYTNNLEQLNIGLYSDWWTRNPAPAGLPSGVEYIHTVRIHQDKVGSDWWGNGPYVDPPSYSVKPSLSTIANTAANQPGSLWLIGNEVDRRDWPSGTGGQDEITPELYAVAFHEIREVIKTADPTARIGIAGMVEATPLRLKYLDRVWDSHYTHYGYSMGDDLDVWAMHGFILREVNSGWGADIPAGLVEHVDYEPEEGFLYGASMSTVREAHYDISYFQQFTENLRTWMAAHGERNKPLLNTEYGILYTNQLGGVLITDAQVSDYLTDSFDYLLNTTDEAIGYPADENRLVQGWVWYSLQDNYWNGKLVNPGTPPTFTPIGTTWEDYVSDLGNPLASQPQINLLVTNLESDPGLVFIPPGSSITVTLRADVANSGNTSTATGNSIVVKFWDGVPNEPGSNEIGSPQIIDDISGCGRFTTVEVEWAVGGSGDRTWYVEVIPITNETNEADNIASSLIPVFEGEALKTYLPVVLK